jgi:hypothetical protein
MTKAQLQAEIKRLTAREKIADVTIAKLTERIRRVYRYARHTSVCDAWQGRDGP